MSNFNYIKDLTEQELVNQINSLAHKENLDEDEKNLQKKLRDEYIRRVKTNLRSHLDNIKNSKNN